jgi:hypothetical protein
MDTDSFLKVALLCWKSYSVRCTKETNITKFRDLFGIGPKAALAVYEAIQTGAERPCVTKYLTMLFCLKSYQTEHMLATATGNSRNTNHK